jgi:hypothetical protein
LPDFFRGGAQIPLPGEVEFSRHIQ